MPSRQWEQPKRKALTPIKQPSQYHKTRGELSELIYLHLPICSAQAALLHWEFFSDRHRADSEWRGRHN